MTNKQEYWFKVWFGKWSKGEFDPEDSFTYVQAWEANAAIRKVMRRTEQEEGEVVTSVIYLGYPQI